MPDPEAPTADEPTDPDPSGPGGGGDAGAGSGWSGRARVVIWAFVLIAVAAAWISVTGFDRMAAADDTDPATENAALTELVEDSTGEAVQPAMLVVVAERDDEGAVQRAARLAERLGALEGAGSVSAPDPRAPAGMDPRVSEDGQFALVAVSATGDREDSDALAARIEAELDGEPGVRLAGGALVQHEVQEIVREDLHRAELLTVPLLLLLALLFFRSVVAAVVPVLIAGVATGVTIALLVLATYVVDVSVFAVNLTTALAMGLGIDYGLLLVSRYREELAAHDGDVGAAIDRTMWTAGRAVRFSSMTVAASMVALAVFPQPYIRSMAVGGVIVAVSCGVTALVLVPALLQVIGRRIDALSPRILRRRRDHVVAVEEGAWYRLCTWVSRRALLVAVATTALLLLMGSPVRHMQLTTADATALPSGSSVRETTEFLQERFPDAGGARVLVGIAGVDAADDAARVAAQVREVVGDAGRVGDPRAIAQDSWLVDVQLPVRALDPAALELVEELRDELPEGVLVGGDGARFLDTRDSVVGHTWVAVLVAVLATMLFVMLLTRSLVLPIKTVIMNALTLFATFGFMVWAFQEGGLSWLLRFETPGALEVGQPAIVCALVFGLSTDYGVFLLTRVRELVDRGVPTSEALAIGTERTGRVITAAALLFCVAMGATGISRLVTVQQVGISIAFAVLLDATIVRGLLQPSIMHLLGERNWWMPKRMARAIERLVPPHA